MLHRLIIHFCEYKNLLKPILVARCLMKINELMLNCRDEKPGRVIEKYVLCIWIWFFNSIYSNTKLHMEGSSFSHIAAIDSSKFFRIKLWILDYLRRKILLHRLLNYDYLYNFKQILSPCSNQVDLMLYAKKGTGFY